MNNIYCVYAYLRKDGLPYYVGKGNLKRPYEEHRKKGKGVHTPKDRSRIVILEHNLTNVGACAIERRMIRWYGRKDLDTGILHNRTDGGEGTFGKIVSPDVRQRIAAGRTGKTRIMSELEKQQRSIIQKQVSNNSGRFGSGRPAWNKGLTGVQPSTRKGVPLSKEQKEKFANTIRQRNAAK